MARYYPAAYYKARYQQRLAAGDCVRCGKKQAEEGQRRCDACIQKNRASDHQRFLRKSEAKRIGFAVCHCGTPLPMGSRHKCCPECRAYGRRQPEGGMAGSEPKEQEE